MKRILWIGNTEHIEEHGLTIEDVEYIVDNHTSTGFSRSSGLPCFFGYTPEGLYAIVIYEEVDEDTIDPVTAYELEGG